MSDIRYSTDNAEFRDDWIEILFAARVHLGLTTSSWNPKDRWSVPHMPDVNRLVQEARKKTSEVVQTDGIASAIDAVKDALLESRPNSDGLRTLPGEEVVGLCVEACGAEFPQDNQWRRWIDGTDIAAAE
ncbi:MAG: hypothetical protein SGJ19_05065 [Planctomycetia bacterium]|nr:hypothetical protein [Planctomycetia bacterium]